MDTPTPTPEDKPFSEPPNDADAENLARSERVPLERVEKLLAEGEISQQHGRVKWSSNFTTLLTMRDAELESLVIYKPQQGERPLWDFPDGTLCYREVAAYIVSKTLGWDIVPPTVLREGPHGIGAMQFYIHHDPQITFFELSNAFVPELQRMALFDVITNNTDRKGGHCLVDAGGKLWGIDHGICFHVQPKLRTVIWDFAGQRIPDNLIVDLEVFCPILDDNAHSITMRLRELMSRGELDAFRMRVRRILRTQTYPVPGPGPNVPWPNV